MSNSALPKILFALGSGTLSLFGMGIGMGLFGPKWEKVQGLDLASVDLRPNWESAWIRDTIANDPAANAIVSGYLSGLTASGYLGDEQGVWVSSGIYPLAQNQGDRKSTRLNSSHPV